MNKKLLSTVLSTLALTSLLILTQNLRVADASPYTTITPITAWNMINNSSFPDLVVLDVRTQSEYDDGHIYNAIWIPNTELAGRIGELAGYKDHEIIVYCRTGGRSADASEILESHNFTKVYNMFGGLTAWESAGYPVWIATVHNLNSTFNYDTIQAAIDAPQTLHSHVILVGEGTYNETIVLNKSIRLVGEKRDTTILDGNFSDNVITVGANNTVIAGFTVRRSGCGCDGKGGIFVNASRNVVVKHNFLTQNGFGILVHQSEYVNIVGNNLTRNFYDGINLYSSREVNVTGNYVKNSFQSGINLTASFNNSIYHNSLIENSVQAFIAEDRHHSRWDNSVEGNFWSDYSGVDLDHDGIGDAPYILDENNTDHHPLMGVFRSFNTSSHLDVETISNSTVNSLNYFELQGTIAIRVSGVNGYGFCRICIPHALMNFTNVSVVINDGAVATLNFNSSIRDNATHRWIYFAYQHSTLNIVIIPEFSFLMVLLAATILLVAALTRKTEYE